MLPCNGRHTAFRWISNRLLLLCKCLLAICNQMWRKTGRASPHVLLNVNWLAAVLQSPCLFCQLLKALNDMTKLGFDSAAPGQASILPYTRVAAVYLPWQSNRLNSLGACKQQAAIYLLYRRDKLNSLGGCKQQWLPLAFALQA